MDDNSPYYRWTSELDLSAYNDPQYGTATGISVDKTSDAGYVLSLTINYGNKSQTFTAENDIRKALGHYQKKVTLNDGSARENMSMIPSACFSVSAGAKWSLYTVRRRLRPWNRLQPVWGRQAGKGRKQL